MYYSCTLFGELGFTAQRVRFAEYAKWCSCQIFSKNNVPVWTIKDVHARNQELENEEAIPGSAHFDQDILYAEESLASIITYLTRPVAPEPPRPQAPSALFEERLT